MMTDMMIQAIGLMAATLTSMAMIPQAFKAIRYRQIKDLSLYTYSLLVTGVVLWVVYGIIQVDWPIILANSVALLPTGIILYLIIKEK